MTDSGTVDQVHAALAAYAAGDKTVGQLEAALNAALLSGLWTRDALIELLRDAVAAGRVPPDIVQRLGPEKSDPTVARAAEPNSEPVSAVAQSSVSGEPITLGQLIAGRYRLERKLGEGGMGVVFLASDQEVQGETFAVKVLSSEIRERPDALALLREEVRRTRALAHPNIVGVYSLNVYRSNVFILMEHLEGKTLQALLDEDFGRGMRFDRAWPIIQDLGAALAYAHDHSVIHGDLKPANVFITTSGKAKLLDFGIARAARGTQRSKNAAVLGALTPAYASCEMLKYLAPDTRDDIYALTIIIYEMLSGVHPFGGLNALEARDAAEKPAPIAFLTDKQNAALRQGLAFERAARTATVEALLAGLAPRVDFVKRRAATSGVVVLAVVSALTIAYFAADKFGFAKHVRSEPPTTASTNIVSDKSIAVLPFTDMSENRDQEYFSDGLSEELIDLLTKVPDLRVSARTSSFFFKGKPTQIADIAKALNVSNVLEGSVQRSGSAVRITAHLVHVDSGYDVWSQTYDRDMKDIFRTQDEIADAVVQALKLKLLTNSSASDRTVNMEAYSLLLQGRYLNARAAEADLRNATQVLQRAVTLDPNYAPAWSELSQSYVRLSNLYVADPVRNMEAGRAAVQRALALNPADAAAHYLFATINVIYEHDWKAAVAEMDAARSADPNLTTPAALVFVTGCNSGPCHEKFIRDISRDLDRDPLNAFTLGDRAYAHYYAGELEAAESDSRRSMELSPSIVDSNFLLAVILIAQHKAVDALSVIQSASDSYYRRAGLALVYQALGRKAEADAALQELLSKDSREAPFQIAQVFAARGNNSAALDWLERDYDLKMYGLLDAKVNPLLRPLAREPRFVALMNKFAPSQ